MDDRRKLENVRSEATEMVVAPDPDRVAAPSGSGGRIKLGRFEELEAYRGVAALLVVVFHAYQFSREGTKAQAYVYEGTPLHILFHNLDTLVSVFFVLSGFLIFLPFAHAAVNRGDRQSARGFLIRRAIRIVPLYYVAILFVWAIYYGSGSDQWVDLVQHLTFTQIFSREHAFSIIGPAWSLSVEVLFYLFVAAFGPLAYHVCARLGAPQDRATLLAGTILALGAVSVAYKWWALYVARVPEDNWPVYFGPLAKADTFAIGMLLAVAVVASGDWYRIGGVVPTLLRLLGLALLAVAFILRLHSPFVELYVHTVVGIAFMLVLASTVLFGAPGRGSAWRRILARPELQFVGLISYSVYIWHEPLMHWLADNGILISTAPAAFPTNALALLVVSVLVGALSHWGAERPAMYLRYLFSREGRLTKRFPE